MTHEEGPPTRPTKTEMECKCGASAIRGPNNGWFCTRTNFEIQHCVPEPEPELEEGMHWVTCPTCQGDCGYDDDLGIPTCTDCKLRGRVQAQEGDCADCHGTGINSGVEFHDKPRRITVLRGTRKGKDISGQEITIPPGAAFVTRKGGCLTCNGKGSFGPKENEHD